MFKIRSIDSFPNVFQNEHYTKPVLRNFEGRELDLKGKWRETIFKNDHPLILELACGKGDYALALAQKYPSKNFIGVDSKGARIFTGAKRALEEKIDNLAFVRMRIENITHFFAPGEADEIWITFPDPFPRDKNAKRRLSNSTFIARYKAICKPGAIIHFKTDNLPLFLFTTEQVLNGGLKILYSRQDIYAAPFDFEELGIQTYYERSHLAEGRKIHYIRFAM